MTDYSLSNSIRACRQLTRASHSSFTPAFSLLPAPKREAMEILYAYNRFTDDLVDRPDIDPETGRAVPAGPRRQRQKLNQWIGALEAIFGTADHPVGRVTDPNDADGFRAMEADFSGCSGLIYLPALKMIVDRFQIPVEPFFHLIDGVESDIEPRTFETFDDCADYCHQVATSVGFSSLAVWGTVEPLFSDPVVHAAKACGVAFQWTNILRDLAEDYGGGRIYLPRDELKRAGLTDKQFGSLLDRKAWNAEKKKPDGVDDYSHENVLRQMKSFEEKFDRLLSKQFERCEIYYSNAAPLYRLIKPDSRKVYGMMWSRYYKLFQKIRRRPSALTRGRVRLSATQKLALLLRWKLLPCRYLKSN